LLRRAMHAEADETRTIGRVPLRFGASPAISRRCGRSKHLVTIVARSGKIGIVFLTLIPHSS
jgi:hypothetical protein